MKMHTALSLALVSTLTFGPAMAESFNERGEDFIASVRISLHSKRQPAVVEFGSFNQRGEDFTATAPSGSSKRYSPVVAELNSFNERGESFFTTPKRGYPTTALRSPRP